MKPYNWCVGVLIVLAALFCVGLVGGVALAGIALGILADEHMNPISAAACAIAVWIAGGTCNCKLYRWIDSREWL